MEEDVKKKLTTTRRAKHPFAGRNTKQAGILLLVQEVLGSNANEFSYGISNGLV